jgi:hypothetical protein
MRCLLLVVSCLSSAELVAQLGTTASRPKQHQRQTQKVRLSFSGRAPVAWPSDALSTHLSRSKPHATVDHVRWAAICRWSYLTKHHCQHALVLPVRAHVLHDTIRTLYRRQLLQPRRVAPRCRAMNSSAAVAPTAILAAEANSEAAATTALPKRNAIVSANSATLWHVHHAFSHGEQCGHCVGGGARSSGGGGAAPAGTRRTVTETMMGRHATPRPCP